MFNVVMTQRKEIVVSALSYSVCSATLILINKVALKEFPFPSLLALMQIVGAVVLIYGSHFFGFLSVDPLRWEYMKPYILYTIAFSFGLYTNMKSLSLSNVETVIVFRAMAPLAVSLLEAMFLNRELPSKRSAGALLLIGLGGLGYASTDEDFQNQGLYAYVWPMAYLASTTFLMVYGKKIIRIVKFKTTSGPTQYTNLLGWPPMIIFAVYGNEFKSMEDAVVEQAGGSYYEYFLGLPGSLVALLALGCIIGTLIGYSSWWCRDKVSATSYTLIGVMNKFVTILVNILMWDEHAGPLGTASLCVSIIGGALYQQAPLKKEKCVDELKDASDEDMVALLQGNETGTTSRRESLA